jgi:RNA polymerase sigma-70 factor (ECF subfamily)
MIAGSTQRFEDRDAQFRELALPLLDDVYTLARYLLSSAADADDAVQECYLRAFRHFDTYHGPAIKPWLFTILRNVCNAEFARRSKAKLRNTEADAEMLEDTAPLWQEVRDTPERIAPRARRSNNPPARCGASDAIPGGDRTTRNQ